MHTPNKDASDWIYNRVVVKANTKSEARSLLKSYFGTKLAAGAKIYKVKKE
jgi:hypothetical protein